jgi:phage tail-like protein
MPMFSVNTQEIDPYRNFKFRIKIDGQYVAGLSKMSALKKMTEVIDWREAGNPSTVRKLPGRTSYQAITFEAGVSHDTTFEDWANLINNTQGDAAMSLAKYRKELVVEVLNMQGVPVIAFRVHRAWVSEYQALPDFDANAHAVAITMLKIEHEGFDRDPSVTEPVET